MAPTRKQIVEAAKAGELERLMIGARQGADFNETDPDLDNESILETVVDDLCFGEDPYRYDVVRLLLELGADPNIMNDDGTGPMTMPMLHMDYEMLRILLEGGADPNKPAGFDDKESFYDWAEFDYRYNVFDFHLPEDPSEDDRKDEDSWLRYLDRMAGETGKRRPDHLFLLRRFGAKSNYEK